MSETAVDAPAFRLYAPEEAGHDGYPLEWHRNLKHAVREEAGFRCVRCQHPYRNGEHGKGEWSPCDETCYPSGAVPHTPARDRTHGSYLPW